MKKLRFKAPSAPKTTHASKDIVRSSPKTTHMKQGDVVRSSPKRTHPNRIKNLGKFAHPPTKLPKTGAKVGAMVKTTKRKSNKLKGSY